MRSPEASSSDTAGQERSPGNPTQQSIEGTKTVLNYLESAVRWLRPQEVSGQILYVGTEPALLPAGNRLQGLEVCHANELRAAWLQGIQPRDVTLAEDSYEGIVVSGVMDHLKGPELDAAIAQLGRWCKDFLLLEVRSRAGEPSGWWETKFLERNFRKHPLAPGLAALTQSRSPASQAFLFQKIPMRVASQHPLSALQAERDLHMDMLRESGTRSTAHLDRYTLAREYVREGMVVVDVACGMGYGTHILASNTGAERVVGVDSSQSAVAYAKTNYGSPQRNVDFRVGDATRLSFIESESVDLVVTFETIEHLANPERFLGEIMRILKPAGTLILSAPNLWVDEQGRNPVPWHMHVYDFAQLRGQVERHLKIDRIYRQNAGGGWKRPQPNQLRLLTEREPTPADQRDAEWWIMVAQKAPAALAAAPAVVKSAPRLVVMDEEARYFELYGRALELLGVLPENGHDKSPEEILASKPEAILLSREWSYGWRLAAAAARRANIPIIYVMDGVIEWSYVWNNLSFVKPEGSVLQPLIAQHLCAIGRHPARILSSLGLADRLHVVGLPRLDGFNRTRTICNSQEPRILISTAKTSGHNVEHKVMVRRALRDLKAWFDENEKIHPVWRIDDASAWELGLTPDRQGTFGEAIQNVAGVVSFASTCLLEAMLKGIPTAQIDYRGTPSYLQSAWQISSPEQVSSVIQELLYPPPEKLAYQEFCLEDELEPGGASERLAQVIEQAIEQARTPSVGGTAQASASFGRLDYRQVHSHLSAFAASPQAILQYELDALQNLYSRAQKELLAGPPAIPAPPAPHPEVAQLEKQCQDQSQTIQSLDQLCKERQATIENLDRLCRERGETISQLDKLCRERDATITQLDQDLRAGRTNETPGQPGAAQAKPVPEPSVPADPSDQCLKEAGALHARGEAQAARAVLARGIVASPEDSALHTALGYLEWKTGHLEAAYEAYTAVVRLTPTSIPALLNRALLAKELGRADECDETLTRILRLEPNHQDALRTLGFLRLSQKRFVLAAQAFEKALEQKPQDITLILALVKCEFEEGDLVAARLDCLRALRIDPNCELAKENLGVIEAQLSRPAPQTSVIQTTSVVDVPSLLREFGHLEYPCANPFSQLYVVPRQHLDVRFCSYHPPVIIGNQEAVYQQGLGLFDEILHANATLNARRHQFLLQNYTGAGCSEDCIWYNKWKATGKGYRLADFLGAKQKFSLGKMWLSMGPDCNVTCRYCLEPSEFQMDFKTCRPEAMNLARDLVRRGGELLLTGGETFLPKWGLARILEELIGCGDAKGQISLHTNGTYLNARNRDLLLRGPVSAVGISMDTLRKDLYEYLRRGTSFDLVWGNALALVKERGSGRKGRPFITILCAVMKCTSGHLRETVDRAVQAGLGISLNALFQAHYSPDFSRKEGLHNLSAQELETLYRTVLQVERDYGPGGPVSYQGFKGQVENLLQSAANGGADRQVVLGGGGHSPRLPHFRDVEAAELLVGEGRFAEARQRIEPHLAKASRSTRMLHVLANIEAGEGNPDKAAELYRKIARLDPMDPKAMTFLAAASKSQQSIPPQQSETEG